VDKVPRPNSHEEKTLTTEGVDGFSVAVAGMHRSGTSLIASMLSDARIDLGSNFIAANRHNKPGYFEDRRFVDLHDALLAANGTDWALSGSPKSMRVPDDLRIRARELIRERVAEAAQRVVPDRTGASSGGSSWGWKDPRTTLFLDFWLEMLPSLSVVVPFRDAASVVASLRRRRDLPMQHHFRGAWPLRKLGFPMTRDGAAIRLWEAYNVHALACARRFPGRVVFIDGTRAQLHMPRVFKWLREDRGVPLVQNMESMRTDPTLMNPAAPFDLRLRSHFRASVANTMDSLQAAAKEMA